MVFSSVVFLCLFLPMALVVHSLSPRWAKNGVLLLLSWIFYGYWRVDMLGLMVAVSLVCWAANLLMGDVQQKSRRWRKLVLSLAVALLLGVLGLFKYLDFVVEALGQVLNRSWSGPGLILPIGISFYIFQGISFLFDRFRGDCQEEKNFITVATYLALFPQLIAGPIVRFKDVAAELKVRTIDTVALANGFERFLIGLSKKVLLADPLAPLVAAIFESQAPSFAEVIVGVSAFSAQLYFDFAGYSDMARGMGQMLGLSFPMNFDFPYHSRTISEFWRRWHISLSTWLRDYLYIPLGGNRKGVTRTYVNLGIVMVLGGLWHGAAWGYVIWGAWHGLWLMVERRVDRGRNTMGWWRGPITLVLVGIGWLFFRAETLNQAGAMMVGLMGFNGWGIGPEVQWQLEPLGLFVWVVALFYILLEPRLSAGLVRSGPMRMVLGFVGGIFSVLSLLANSHSPFLYFQF